MVWRFGGPTVCTVGARWSWKMYFSEELLGRAPESVPFALILRLQMISFKPCTWCDCYYAFIPWVKSLLIILVHKFHYLFGLLSRYTVLVTLGNYIYKSSNNEKSRLGPHTEHNKEAESFRDISLLTYFKNLMRWPSYKYRNTLKTKK